MPLILVRSPFTAVRRRLRRPTGSSAARVRDQETSASSNRWMVVRNAKIQRHVGNSLFATDLHLQRRTVPEAAPFRRPRSRLGVSQRRRRQKEFRPPSQ
ncbi:unnamed protein product, partial [Nesidiocoris tenuis]